MRYDVVALGELLIDFTDSGVSPQGNPLFEANPGGAPGNVLAMLAKLNRRTAFLGKVGDDLFGRMVVEAIAGCGISPAGVVTDAAANTTLAFVHNEPGGDRAFSFFRKPGADTRLTPEELDRSILEDCAIFHFGSLSLTHQPAREATRHGVAIARQAGANISFDPNLRPLLWENPEEARRQIDWGCSQCDILKIAQEELVFLTGAPGLAGGIRCLREKYPGIKLLFVTQGKKGAVGIWGEHRVSHPAFCVETVDTTGAGDTFCGCCLSHILELDLDRPNRQTLEEMVTFANAAASLVTTKKGALRSMPALGKIRELLGRG